MTLLRKRTFAPSLTMALALGLTGAVATTSVSTPVSAGEVKAGEVRAGELTISSAVTRQGLPNRPMAGYMTIATGGAGDVLTSATSPAFTTIELHTVEETEGVFKMLPIDAITVPEGGMAMLEPGGMHLMMFGATEAYEPGDTIPVTLRFQNAGDVDVAIEVVKKIKGGHGHSGHSN